jgi:hypothetical protein
MIESSADNVPTDCLSAKTNLIGGMKSDLVFWLLLLDAFVRNPESPFFVIPTKAGTQDFHSFTKTWTPFFSGVTTLYETIFLVDKKPDPS